jgi:hypothetical protein
VFAMPSLPYGIYPIVLLGDNGFAHPIIYV